MICCGSESWGIQTLNQSRLVSVVIPCFNAAKYLPGAIRSLLAQGVPGTEIIVVDDQSTDDSRAVAESLAGQCQGVRVLRQPVNSGPSAARNVGLRQASGRYVCFLDADDEYAPGFFAKALSLLERDSELAAVVTGVELVDCHREVHPVQLQALASSFPCNMMVKKAVADVIGGFPEDPTFRGKVGGEDVMFKMALSHWFKVVGCEDKFVRYRVKRGSYFDYFLDRSRVVDGRLVPVAHSPEEQSGELDAARRRYLDQVAQRIGALELIRNPASVFPGLTNRAFQAVAAFDRLREHIEPVEGFLHPQEGYGLYHWAKEGPGQGAIVEIGSLMGRSTCWLASGTRVARREKSSPWITSTARRNTKKAPPIPSRRSPRPVPRCRRSSPTWTVWPSETGWRFGSAALLRSARRGRARSAFSLSTATTPTKPPARTSTPGRSTWSATASWPSTMSMCGPG